MKRTDYFKYFDHRFDYSKIIGTETSSQEVKYLPFYAFDNYSSLQRDSKYTLNKGSTSIERETVIFGLPENIYIDTRKSLTKFDTHFLSESMFPTLIEYKDMHIFVGKGIVMDMGKNILFIIVADSKHIDDCKYDKMFVSNILYQPKYKPLYTKIFNSLISPALEAGVEMRVISSKKIKDTIYKTLYPTLNDFDTVDEYTKFVAEVAEESFNHEENILIPIERSISNTKEELDILLTRDYGAILIEDSLMKIAEEIWESYKLPSNAFTPSITIMKEYIEEHIEDIRLLGIR